MSMRLVSQGPNAQVELLKRRQVVRAVPQQGEVHGDDAPIGLRRQLLVNPVTGYVLNPTDRLATRSAAEEGVQKKARAGQEHHVEVDDDAAIHVRQEPRQKRLP